MNDAKELIEIVANIAAILTAAVALIVSITYTCGQKNKIKSLEDYLRTERQAGKDKGQRSILHLVANVGLTEAEIIQASFKSRRIKRRLTTDPETDLANSILFEFDENAN